jgi:hypothetical protein
MNPIDERLSGSEDSRFDLLVDDELSEEERRDLLMSLEREPGGWRRCALAFLEAQSWKQALGDINERMGSTFSPTAIDNQEARQVISPANQPSNKPAHRAWLLEHFGTLAAMAASFFLALYLGTRLQEAWHGGAVDEPGLTIVADKQNPEKSIPQADNEQSLMAQSEPSADAVSGPWQTVTLSLPAGPEGDRQSIDLPVTEQTNIDESWLQSLSLSAFPPELIQALQQNGYQLRQQQAILPLQMNDGRQLVVPVDQLEVQYVGNPTY